MAGPSRSVERGRALRTLLIVVAALLALPLAFAHIVLRGSLPALDGGIEAAGLAAAVTVTRDSLGTPTLQASNRRDLAYATGFVHAQDRFFQMDLSRRLAAGELAELFGAVALEQDRKARLFRFRSVAQRVVARAPPEQRALIEAYTRGVNAGLASLRSRPWEYWVLRSRPAAWRPEDSALVPYAMWWDLQYRGLNEEKTRRRVDSRLRGAKCENGWSCAIQFFYPHGTSWDAPNSASENGLPSQVATIRVPTADELDVRRHVSSATHGSASRSPERAAVVGSNAWAVSGKLTSTGAALVASDMHLGLRVPTVWYRMRLRVGQGEEGLDLNGLTLPGAPVLVAGSNGHIAWGFTNAYGKWADVHRAPCSSNSREAVTEIIHVKGASDEPFVVRSGPEGLLFEADAAGGECWFVRWLAAVSASTNFNILNLETAKTAAEAVALAPAIGIPHQNLMVGDREGHIAWSIVGRTPAARAGTERFAGEAWTSADSHPRLVDPPVGRVWTANARSIDDTSMEALIGGDEALLGAHYDLGARAQQIRDGLLAVKSGAKPADMLRIQLDDRALFLARWQELLVELLDDAALKGHPERAAFKRIVAQWRARASADSVGYRLVRGFHSVTEHAVWDMMLDALDIDATDAPPPPQFEGALWELVSTQPMHMLAPSYASWRDFLLTRIDAVLKDLKPRCPQLDRCTWGLRTPVEVRHPLSRALPFAASFLDMPAMQLPGDHDMPRVQDGAFGASERFSVSPGHETEAYLHIAGGQSGHPLSPYYRAGFTDWATGTPTPFLPGPPQHELALEPAK